MRWDDARDRYVIVVGERRWRAARLAGLETVACLVVHGEPTAEDLLEDQLVENALREDLKPIEQARAFKALLTSRGLSQRQLADRIQISHATIARTLALLELPAPIQGEVEAGRIAPDTAYQLSKVEDPGEQAALARAAAEGRLRRDEVQERTRTSPKARGQGRGVGKARPRKDTERTLRASTGVKLTLECRKGLDDALIVATLEEVLGRLRAEASGDAEAA